MWIYTYFHLLLSLKFQRHTQAIFPFRADQAPCLVPAEGMMSDFFLSSDPVTHISVKQCSYGLSGSRLKDAVLLREGVNSVCVFMCLRAEEQADRWGRGEMGPGWMTLTVSGWGRCMHRRPPPTHPSVASPGSSTMKRAKPAPKPGPCGGWSHSESGGFVFCQDVFLPRNLSLDFECYLYCKYCMSHFAIRDFELTTLLSLSTVYFDLIWTIIIQIILY